MTHQVKKEVTIVGGGSSAHVLIPFLSKSGFSVNILTRKPKEWQKQVLLEYQSADGDLLDMFDGELTTISDKPEDVIPQSNFVVLCMPVCKYRIALHSIAPHLAKDREVFVGTIYGQAGFNWMVNEIEKKFNLTTITTFAMGLIPWICRIIEYGRRGVIYGGKKHNLVAVSPADRFDYLHEELLKYIGELWMDEGKFHQADNFLSLTLSVDNQIIHPSRCYGLFKKYEGRWDNQKDIPFFYRDFDRESAALIREIDDEYSKIRDAIKTKYPKQQFTYMLDYLNLERFTYESESVDIQKSFTSSDSLGAIKPPTVQLESGEWVIDKNHRFFTDDIHYGLCIAKWIADQLEIRVPTIDSIIDWAQNLRKEKIIEGNRLLLDSESLTTEFMSGIPPVYELNSVDEILG